MLFRSTMTTVIKVDEQDPTLIKRLETINVSDHLGEARLVLRASRTKAKELLRDTYVEAESIREEAAEKGYEAGFRRGYEAGGKAGYDVAFEEAKKTFIADQEQLIDAMTDMISQFEKRKRDLFIAATEDVLRFAMKVSAKVTKQLGMLNREAAVANLEAALRLVESKTDLQLHIHPLDRTAIERFVKSFGQQSDRARHFSIVTDESISPGGCHLHTPDCEIDATLDTQIEQIAVLMVGAKELPE